MLQQLERRDLLAAIPVLQSLPGAPHTIFLDFDGHVTEGTTWNSQFHTIHAPPFDADGMPYRDGQPSFNQEEVDRMLSIWERMAEDFRPFNVNVTTEDPAIGDSQIFEIPGQALRVVFTSKFDDGIGGTGQRWFELDTQGIAANSWEYGHDTPIWVFSNHRLAGEIGSHEVGHALGLDHDGLFIETGERIEYQGEHGSGITRWSPIMGQGNVLSQWSKGDEVYGTNNQDDVGILAKALGRRPDDYPTTGPLAEADSTTINLEGVIETEGDKDTFSFTVTQLDSRVSLSIVPWHNGPNLDIAVSLFGLDQGTIIPFGDPTANPSDALGAEIDLRLAPDTYYLTVDGVGKAPVPGDRGYSDYGSLGYYRIIGSIGTVLPGDVNTDGVLSAADIDALHAATITSKETRDSTDLNQDGDVSQTDVELLLREYLHSEYGDLDLNGTVDFADFHTLAQNFGMSEGGWADGDLDGDRQVTLADFLILRQFFGFVA